MCYMLCFHDSVTRVQMTAGASSPPEASRHQQAPAAETSEAPRSRPAAQRLSAPADPSWLGTASAV